MGFGTMGWGSSGFGSSGFGSLGSLGFSGLGHDVCFGCGVVRGGAGRPTGRIARVLGGANDDISSRSF